MVGVFPTLGRAGLLSLLQAGIGSVSRWVSGTVNSIDELRRSREEVQQLRAQLAFMEQRSRDVVQLAAENQQLSALLQLTDIVPPGSISAAVIGRDPGSLFETVTINRGWSNGVRKDAPVVASADGFQALVGRVAWSGPFTAIVQPVLESSFYVTARLQRTRYDGIIMGDPHSDQLIMRYVPLSAQKKVEIGDLVITAGFISVRRLVESSVRRSLYPRGIYIGRVHRSRLAEHGDSIELIVKPLINFNQLDYVVVLPSAEQPDE